MTNKYIGAFSSDNREIYKADIYKVMSLPNDGVIHFRYKKKYVDNDILHMQPEKYKENKVIIYLTQGNTDATSSENENLTNISIREAEIVKCFYSTDTDVFHIYLKLSNFVDAKIIKSLSGDELPPYKFLSKISITKNKDTWVSRVKQVKNSFATINFFFIKGIYLNEKEIKPLEKNKELLSYKLKKGNTYNIKMSLGNPNETKSKIKIIENNNDTIINHINPIENSAQYDDISIPIYIKSTPSCKQSTFLSIQPFIDKNEFSEEYKLNIELELCLSIRRALIFGFLSTIASMAITPSSNYIISLPCIFIASAGLFYFFGKK
ncbi:TPA: hypothetical protein ACGZ88_000093 [Morganella morganii]